MNVALALDQGEVHFFHTIIDPVYCQTTKINCCMKIKVELCL